MVDYRIRVDGLERTSSYESKRERETHEHRKNRASSYPNATPADVGAWETVQLKGLGSSVIWSAAFIICSNVVSYNDLTVREVDTNQYGQPGHKVQEKGSNRYSFAVRIQCIDTNG